MTLDHLKTTLDNLVRDGVYFRTDAHISQQKPEVKILLDSLCEEELRLLQVAITSRLTPNFKEN